MEYQYRRCATLIDEVDELIDQSRTHREERVRRLTLSRTTQTGPKSTQYLEKKHQLLNTLKETFIDVNSKEIKLSALIMFCHDAGVELITHRTTGSNTHFKVRTHGFDVVITS